MRHRVRVLMLLLVVGVVATGCARRYRITDLSTGDVYYSADFRPAKVTDTGRAIFEDAATGAIIRLDDYDYERINRKTFRRAVAESER
jgi:hypothetical protein